MHDGIQAEMKALHDGISRDCFATVYNTALMINQYVGYDKYAVPIPECMWEELGLKEAENV